MKHTLIVVAVALAILGASVGVGVVVGNLVFKQDAEEQPVINEIQKKQSPSSSTLPDPETESVQESVPTELDTSSLNDITE